MKRQLALVGILLRKDLRLYWPFAVLLAVLLVLQQIPALVAAVGPLGGVMQLLIPLSAFLLILVVCYEDAVVSVKHDWLTRPIPGPTLFFSKALFVLGAVVVPQVLGVIVNNLYAGHSLSEALLAGISFGPLSDKVVLIALVMAFAAITSNIRQAVIILLAGFVALAVLARFLGTAAGFWYTGSNWVSGLSLQLSIFVVAGAVLWLQYRHRYTKAARLLVCLALIASPILVASMTWPHVFAVQKLFSPDPSAAAFVQVQVPKGCFPASSLPTDQSRAGTGPAVGIVPTLFSEEQRRNAAPGAVAFATRLVRTSIPAGDLLTVGQTTVTYRIAGADIEPAHADPNPVREPLQWKTMRDGTLAWDDYWLLSKGDIERLAAVPGVQMQIDYSLSLAAPVAEARFLADGRRASFPGIGYCSAKFDRVTGSVAVDCFKAGAQPSQLVASLEGAPELGSRVSGYPNYRPAVLTLWGGGIQSIQLPAKGDAVPLVKVTAYQARAHFDRHFVVAGVLGGPVPQCPVP